MQSDGVCEWRRWLFSSIVVIYTPAVVFCFSWNYFNKKKGKATEKENSLHFPFHNLFAVHWSVKENCGKGTNGNEFIVFSTVMNDRALFAVNCELEWLSPDVDFKEASRNDLMEWEL